MAKNVFRAVEVQVSGERVQIAAPERVMPLPSFVEDLEPVEYTGPTADDLRREAEAFKQNWDREKEGMVAEAEAEAERIIKEAENTAFEEIRKKTEQAQKAKKDAELESERVVAEAEERAAKIIADAESKSGQLESEAYAKGKKEGFDAGWQEGKAEADRVIERLHIILSKAVERRHQIMEESEAQIVELVISMARKVVKAITESQKNVVLNNVVQALAKLRAKSDIVIRVNLDDLSTTTEHAKEIMERIERVNNVTVAEDSTVDRGGCIIETDFGEIDARISSQLREIEERIREISPIRSTPKQE
ncbi:MAG: flagellar assembly protein FliH [Spirochaetaceae bacterium]|nr:MAG: flagellar assembly protein FliH [Spirochaetaceae bacterium]